jgi:hypothetical protein
MQKVRSRLVNFRVTDDEFQQLKDASDRHGARCLSAFARTMVLSAGAAGAENRVDELASFDRRLAVLEESMARLSNALSDSSVNVHGDQK